MRFAEKTVDNINTDYWFLRGNGVRGSTALIIVGIAYKGEDKE